MNLFAESMFVLFAILTLGAWIGHFERVGTFRFYVPPAAKKLTREPGLMLFLAGAGGNLGKTVNIAIRKKNK
jgi:uncharacterized transporter YbjL